MECNQCGKQLVKQKRFCSKKCYAHYKSDNPNDYKPFNLQQWHIDNPELSKKAKEKHLESVTGKPAWNKGKKGLQKWTNKQHELAKERIGPKSYSWKGGKWLYWRKQTLLRDNYTCKECGLRDKEIMDLDHIKPMRKSGKNRDDMKLADIEAHGGIENLQTLCPNCHKRKTIRDNKSGHLKSL